MLKEWLQSKFSPYASKSIVVWYDPEGTLASLVNRQLAGERELLVFEGSYLALRFALETQDPFFEQKWLVYVPEAPPAQSWLKDWEMFGARLELDFLSLLRDAGQLSIDQELRHLFTGARAENSRRLVRNWDILMGSRPVNKDNLVRALLAIAMRTQYFDLRSAVLQFLGEEAFAGRLEEMGLFDVFRGLVEKELGLAGLPVPPEELRRRLAAAVLLTELVEKSGQLAGAFEQLLPETAKRAIAVELASFWRAGIPWRESYVRWAHFVEREYRLGERINVDERLLALPTFLVVDHLWLKEAEMAAGPRGGNFAAQGEKLKRLAEGRRRLFWAQAGVAPWWEALALAASLHQGCAQALADLPRLEQMAELVDRYTAGEGWWRLDYWALKLAAAGGALTPEQQERFTAPAWRLYREYVDRSARHFGELVVRRGWQPAQTRFWTEFVGRDEPGSTGIIFVDALRFDLACCLKEDLARTGEFTVALSGCPATLPGITEVGMAALLPGAENGLAVKVEKDTLTVYLNGCEVTGKNRRLAYLGRVLGAGARILDLPEVERCPKLPGNVRTLVVFWDGIDEFGTFTGDISPQTFFELVGRLRRLIVHLRSLGCERVFVAADHGFLFLPAEAGPPVRLPVSAGEGAVWKKRFAAGRFAPLAGTWKAGAAKLGLLGETLFVFPAGTAVFAVGETGAFFHGGLSLQEAIVPVMVIRAGYSPKVGVQMELPETITSGILRVPLQARVQTLLDAPRRVCVEVTGEGIRQRSEVIEISPQVSQMSVTVSWLPAFSFGSQLPERLVVRLIDADNGDVLEQREVTVATLF